LSRLARNRFRVLCSIFAAKGQGTAKYRLPLDIVIHVHQVADGAHIVGNVGIAVDGVLDGAACHCKVDHVHSLVIVQHGVNQAAGESIAAAIARGLSAWDFEVRTASDFKRIADEIAEYEPHLVLLDITLPFYNGFYWCSELRRNSRVPVVFISSAADNMNIVMAMNMGGDDFIAKPFDMSLLTAKIQALLRRTYDFAEQVGVIEHNGAKLNTSEAALYVGQNRIELTRNEYRILQTLMENKGKVVSREKLMDKLWETDCFIDENTLTVNVARLRRKLESAGLPGFITTKVGMGYIVA